jgi:hypothetical protein
MTNKGLSNIQGENMRTPVKEARELPWVNVFVGY